jgi:hypothetical protein
MPSQPVTLSAVYGYIPNDGLDLNFVSNDGYAVSKTSGTEFAVSYTDIAWNSYAQIVSDISGIDTTALTYYAVTVVNTSDTPISARIDLYDDVIVNGEPTGTFLNQKNSTGDMLTVQAGKGATFRGYSGGDAAKSIVLMFDSSYNQEDSSKGGSLIVRNFAFFDATSLTEDLELDFYGDTVDNSIAGHPVYTVTKVAGDAFDISYTSVVTGTYANIFSDININAENMTLLSMKVKNNGSEDVNLRIDLWSGYMDGATPTGTFINNRTAPPEATNGDNFTVLSGHTDTLEIEYYGTAKAILLFIDSMWEAAQVTKAGNISITEIKFVLRSFAVNVTGGDSNMATAYTGDTVTLIPAAPDTGKEFDYWLVNDGGVTVDGNVFVMGGADVDVEAVYKFTTYTVIVNGGSYTGTPQYGQEITLSPGTPPDGEAFDHWTVISGGVTISANKFIMPANDVEVTAVFEDIGADKYSITVNGGLADFTSASKDDTVTLTVTAGAIPTGKQFKEWTSDVIGVSFTKSGEDYTFSMPGEAIVITATYEFIDYDIIVNYGSYSGTENYGETITLIPDAPASGKVFDHWTVNSGDITISGNTFTMPASDVEVTAVYVDTKVVPSAFNWDGNIFGIDSSNPVYNLTDNYDGSFGVTYTSITGGTYNNIHTTFANNAGYPIFTFTVTNNTATPVAFMLQTTPSSVDSNYVVPANGVLKVVLTKSDTSISFESVMWFIDTAVWQDTASYSGDITLSGFAFLKPVSVALVNADFEDTLGSEWTLTGTGTLALATANALSGKYATSGTVSAGTQKLTQEVDGGFSVGDTVVLSFYIRGSNNNMGTISAVVGAQTILTGNNITNGWVKQTVLVTLTSGDIDNGKLIVGASCTTTGNNRSVWFDSFTVSVA